LDCLIKLENISKLFPGVQALDGVTMNINRGEIHSVVGENGAGKSTLMKILSGAEQPDKGYVILDNHKVSFQRPIDAQNAGIAIVYQELSVFPSLSVAENIYANRQPVYVCNIVNRKKLKKQAVELMALFNLYYKPNKLLEELDMADKQIIEILRAVSQNPKLLILDEPTSSLSLSESERLFNLLEKLHDNGMTILFVSHHLDEVMHLSDRISVLRDGKLVGTVNCKETNENKLVEMMVGRAVNLYKVYPEIQGKDKVALAVDSLKVKDLFENITFEAYQGEVLGFAGLVGSGRTELAQTIFGLRKSDSGMMKLFGQSFSPRSCSDAINAKLAYMPEDRKSVGLFLNMNLTDNLIAPQLYDYTRYGLLNSKKGVVDTQSYINQVGIVARDPKQRAVELSGGNQQKLLLAMWLAVNPKVLIVDEPTRGIDVGAKVEIHEILRQLAEKGMCIILISSELPELMTMSDRIAVMYDHKLMGILDKKDATQEKIMVLASGIESMEV
jgi:rhamnose transport system ATP-binding protein